MRLLIVLFCVFGLTIVACGPNEDGLLASGPLDERSDYEFVPFGLNFPSEATTSIQANVWSMALPPGYSFKAIKADGGEVHALSTGAGAGVDVGITCTCDSGGGGCSPVSQGGEEGCLMSSCKTCTQSMVSDPGDIEAMAVLEEDASLLVEDFGDMTGYQFLPRALVEHSYIAEYLSELEDFVWQDYDSDSPTKDVIVNIKGNLAVMSIPDDADDQSLVVTGGVDGGDAGFSCVCNTEGSCKKQRKMTVKICDATNCKSCTMNLMVTDPGTGVSMQLVVDALGRW